MSNKHKENILIISGPDGTLMKIIFNVINKISAILKQTLNNLLENQCYKQEKKKLLKYAAV